jgi:ABC-2 type transport system permease protein
MNLLTAELSKIVTLPATWIALVVAAIGETWARGVLLPVYAVAAVAVQAAGSEYRGGQLRVTLAAAPRRGRLYAAKLAASVGSAGAAGCVVFAFSAHWALMWLLGLLLSGTGAGLATVTRGSLVPLAGLGVAALASMAGLLPWARGLLPHDAMAGALDHKPGSLLVLAAWAGVSIAAGGLSLHRRDG